MTYLVTPRLSLFIRCTRRLSGIQRSANIFEKVEKEDEVDLRSIFDLVDKRGSKDLSRFSLFNDRQYSLT